MKRLYYFVLLFIVVGFGTTAFFVTQNQKKEGEVTIGDLVEQSRRNIPGAIKKSVVKKVDPPIAPATYKETLLILVPEKDQQLIRDGGSELPFAIFVPTKILQGFSLSPTSISNGVQNDVALFHYSFSHTNGDRIVIDEYRLQEYLTATGQTIAEFANGKKPIIIGEKKIYIADIQTKTSGRFQYYQGVTVISDPVMIRVEYKGEKKLSDSDLTELAASFTR